MKSLAPKRIHRAHQPGTVLVSAPRTLVRVQAGKRPIDFIADNIQDPILRVAVREPLAFWGGVFAGALRLNVNDDPLKGWVARTAQQGDVDRTPTSQLSDGSQSS